MADRASTETPADRTRRLRDGAAATVESTHGVLRLEPTLRNAVRRIRSATGGQLSPGYVAHTASAGITLTERGNVVNMRVEITVGTGRAADLTAIEVQDRLRTYLIRQRLSPGVISVAVLDIES